MQCPTVRVKSAASPTGFVIINESDFDKSVHELHEEMNKRELTASEVMLINNALIDSGKLLSFDVGPSPLAVDAKAREDIGPNARGTDWRKLHWKQQIKLARSKGYDGEPNISMAREFLAARDGN